jgi:hypothetical protein
MTECTVCCNTMNQTTRRLVSCDFCPYIACLSCTKTYILSTVHQPHCMNCRKEWSLEMMNKHFPKSFLREEYRKMRETILFEEEKTYLPPLQAEAERILSFKKCELEKSEIQDRITKNHLFEDQLVKDQRIKHRALEAEINAVHARMVNLRNNKAITTKKFVMKCVMNECRGFLSEKYVCGLCNEKICKDCHSPIRDEHVCNPDEVATITELNKTTKPCPKCQVRIYKTDGCDQMFCISCHTAFSWRTGEIEEGVIHNPHYFQALREGNITDPRHRQHQGECGPMPTYNSILYLFKNIKCPKEKRLMETYYQQFVHHRHFTLVELTRREDMSLHRIKYLTNEYDEKTFKQKIYVNQQHLIRRREERQIMDSFVTIGEELFRSLTLDNHTEILTQLNTLKDVTFKAISGLNDKYQHAGYIRAKDLFYMLNL